MLLKYGSNIHMPLGAMVIVSMLALYLYFHFDCTNVYTTVTIIIIMFLTLVSQEMQHTEG